MSPIKKEFILYLEDMLHSMDRIEEYLTGLDFRKFKQTYIVVDATIRNFEVIGEAAKNILIDIQKKYPTFHIATDHELNKNTFLGYGYQ